MHANPLLDNSTNNQVIINSKWQEKIKRLAEQDLTDGKYFNDNFKKELFIEFQNLTLDKLIIALKKKPIKLLVLKFDYFDNKNDNAYFFQNEFWVKNSEN